MAPKKEVSEKTETPVEELTYELAYRELEEIVSALEIEEQTLDESLALYERGRTLAQRCAGLLDAAELQVREQSG